ncbi:MAG TPA: F0F1 ATP synthase subunit epsilon [Terriglobales bacterium]|nr:F0F1 ATP synthase subunit epsilon [Terriglobales bacterium]
MADTFEIEIVTPERVVERDVVTELQLPTTNGYIGVLAGHAPLITELGIGEISYKADGQTYKIAVAWGFAEVLPNKTTILAEVAERAEDIDVARAQQAKQRAEELLRSGNPDTDFERAKSALERATARLDVAQRK